jgi:hypothetical protein
VDERDHKNIHVTYKDEKDYKGSKFVLQDFHVQEKEEIRRPQLEIAGSCCTLKWKSIH